ncbi:MAG: hypothetical protein J5922_05200 [Clostridia bacterium]|nr:hypothetical protein [Clostridia bacterium]
MGIYTTSDFDSALERSGLSGFFSDADLKLSRQNPDVGMNLLTLKRDYVLSENETDRSKIHNAAENLRKTYGNYSGGSDGSGYYLYADSKNPSSFKETAAPAYKNNYEEEYEKALSDLLGYGDFSYDLECDPLYSQYKKAYLRDGKRAMEDAAGISMANTLGNNSSYAVSAAAMAENNYRSKLADVIPQTYEFAYEKYKNGYDAARNNAEMLRDAKNDEYERYLDELKQYNTDREFDYGRYLDDIKYASERENDAYERDLADRKLALEIQKENFKENGYNTSVGNAAKMAEQKSDSDNVNIPADADGGIKLYADRYKDGKVTNGEDYYAIVNILGKAGADKAGFVNASGLSYYQIAEMRASKMLKSGAKAYDIDAAINKFYQGNMLTLEEAKTLKEQYSNAKTQRDSAARIAYSKR